LRRRHYPPERNVVPAHLTLFHSLPDEHRREIVATIDVVCRGHRPIRLSVTGLRLLGNGVAVAFSSAELVALRHELAREWAMWLTPQDSARIAPHVTIQNKVPPDAARALHRELNASFRLDQVRGEGLNLWRYLGGPWELVRRFKFTGR
jgi:2'-5' RNA ligase